MRVIELDLFRFIAAFGVVLYHYVAWFSSDYPQGSIVIDNVAELTQFGFLGVPLFFMISGFVILASAMHRTNTEFVASRIARLYPVYWLCVSITGLFILMGADIDKPLELKTYLINLTMLHSFIGVGSLDGVYWTLAKEIQFYFCIFLLMFFRVLKRVKIWLILWLLLTLSFMLFQQPFFMGWFITPEYSAFFIAGVCFYMLLKGDDSEFYIKCLYSSLILASVSTYHQAAGFLQYPTVLTRMICVLIVAIFYWFFWLVVNKKIQLKESKMLLTFGAMTYPLYLIHNVVGKFILDKLLSPLGPELAILTVRLIMLFASYLIYVLYEKRVSPQLKIVLFLVLNNIQSSFSRGK